jgi:adenosine kinase
MDIEKCAKMGSVCASFAVECYGTQEYSFSPDEFDERFKKINFSPLNAIPKKISAS